MINTGSKESKHDTKVVVKKSMAKYLIQFNNHWIFGKEDCASMRIHVSLLLPLTFWTI